MIQEGDIVRYKNSYIAPSHPIPLGARKGGRKNRFKRFRGKQQLMQVVSVVMEDYDHTTRHHNTIVRLDNNQTISTDWLSFVRRPKSTKPRPSIHLQNLRGKTFLRIK